VLLFVAGVAAVAVALARRSTVADGHVMEAEVLALVREYGVVALTCDPKIPIGHGGAVFSCLATLRDGVTQRLDCTLERDGQLTAKAAGTAPRQIRPSGDPWGRRP